MTTRTPKTKTQKAVEDLERQTRIADRAKTKRDRLTGDLATAETEYQEAEADRAFLAGSPFLPAAPVRRTRRAPAAAPARDADSDQAGEPAA